MGYYHGEQSVGLKPILMALSGITVAVFGIGYFIYASSLSSHSTDSTTPYINSDAGKSAVTKTAPNKTAATSGNYSQRHGHV